MRAPRIEAVARTVVSEDRQLFLPNINCKLKPNVVVEWLTPLLHIRDVPGSNLGPETGYPD
jgi:hypothetical protein